MIRMLATVVAALLLAGGAAAQGYPNRPLQILVGYGPGGGTERSDDDEGAKLGV